MPSGGLNRFIDFLGRILNRFTKDLGCMDDQLPQNFLDTIFVNSVTNYLDRDDSDKRLFHFLVFLVLHRCHCCS